MPPRNFGRADYWAPGDYNAICDRCGRKFKASELQRTWDGFMVCPRDWEPRHPQDFVRGLPDPVPVPWSRSPGTPTYVIFCTPNGTTAVAGFSVAGCWVAGYIHPAFDPTVTS